MITREFNLYLHAGHSIPLVINANQYDRGEQWLFKLFNSDGTQYTPSSGAIVGIKSDNLGIINTGTVDAQGRVVINETQQMTAAVGKAVFELLIDDQTHGTANFVVLVEPKPGDNADLSESDLSLIQQAIDGTSETAIAQGVSDWMDENLTPTTPVVDTSLTVSGAAADSAKVGQEISDLKSEITQLEAIPRSVKIAMDNLLAKLMYMGDPSDDYMIFHAWALAINPLYITAVFDQGENVIYDTDSLENLKQYLTVTVHYDDGDSEAVSSYTLSGELTEGTSVITVSYESFATTFGVTVTKYVVTQPTWESGTYSAAMTQVANTARLRTPNTIDEHAKSITPATGYGVLMCCLDANGKNYKSGSQDKAYWDIANNTFSKDGVYYEGNVDLDDIKTKVGNYSYFKLIAKRSDGSAISVSEGANIVLS